LLDKRTHLDNAVLRNARLDGVVFDNTNLSTVDWSQVPRLQDERLARLAYGRDTRDATVPAAKRPKGQQPRGKRKARATRHGEYQAAVRAYRLLAVALQAKGMNEEAGTYSYRAQICQRQVLRYSGWRAIGRYLFSWFLDALAGYGYRPGLTLGWYLVVIIGFAEAYYAATHGWLTFGLPASQVQALQWYEALILSISSFHGRGFFQPIKSLGDPVAVLAAVEAITGLLIEISFIATFTQRFFGSK